MGETQATSKSTAQTPAAAESEKDAPRRRGISRRKFLGVSALATAGVAGAYYGTRRCIPAALIGAGIRGTQLAWHLRYLGYVYNPYAKLRAICDAYLPNAEAVRDGEAHGAEVYQDYRDVLDREDIKAVFIAAPDHWHAQIAIEAMQAGKAVYCEKPMTLTVAEGQRMVEVARETGAVVQIGTQQRCHGYFRTACELVTNGRLGKLTGVEITLGEDLYDESVRCDASTVPDGMNWDLFLGQTELVEYCRARHKMWGHFYDYSGGMITGWGSHQLDIAHWGMGISEGGPVRVSGTGTFSEPSSGYDVPRTFVVEMDYPNDVRVTIRSSENGESDGITFVGDRGRVFCNRGRVSGKPVEELADDPLPEGVRMHAWPAGKYGKTAVIQHQRNFLHCIETGAEPIAGVVNGHRVASALHLANISIRLGREIRFDPESEQIIGDEEANGMLSRKRRSPYVI